MIFSLKSFAQPTADFTVNATHGCRSLSVFFTDISTGSPTSWLWNFGNGQTSVVQNPSVVYSSPGVYSVTLKVSNGLGTNTLKKTNYIVVDQSPVAFFNVSSSSGCLPFPVTFTDLSSGANGTITNWSWDFGDGTTSNQQNPSHIYTIDSSYTVKLTVQSSTGCTDSVIMVNAVNAAATPVPAFVTAQKDVCASVGVRFINQTKGNYTSSLWYFGDGDTITRIGNPLHLYKDAGFMDVKLVVGNYGCTDSIEIKNYVHIKPPIVRVRYNFNCDSPYTRNFLARYVGVKTYLWNFGDGTTENTDKTPSHTYQQPGTYTVSLYATSDSCDYLDTVIVTIVDEHPTFSFSSSNTAICSNDLVKFTAANYNPVNIDSFAWDYGDGNSSILSSSASSNYLYNQNGIYNPSLIVKNILGCSDTIRNNNNSVIIHGPKAQFSVDTFTCTNFKLNFNDASTGDGSSPITQWQWDYGDGNSGTYNAAPFIHQYSSNGTFNVSLKVIDANGCSDTTSILNAVNVIQKPIASLVIIDTLNCFSSPVSFFDRSTGQQLGRHWFLGDGDTSTQSYFQHTYAQPGIYNTEMVIGTQQGCSDTAKATVRVMSLPNIDAGRDTVLCLGQLVNMKVTGAQTYAWLPNPSLSCYNCAFPLANPVKSTMFYVTGTDNNGCSAVDSVYVEVKQHINLGFKFAVDSVCYMRALQLSAQGAELYTWVPNVGLNNAKIADPVATLTKNTSYTVIGTDSKNCFTDSAHVSVVVVGNPQFDIIDTSISLNAGSLYTIKTTSSVDVVKWQWSPPTDLSCNNCPQPQSRIDKVSQYTGTAYNSFGCTATDKIKIASLCNNQVLFIPNTFSPNGDSHNDRFYPRGNGIYSIKSMRIFTKLGQPVFQKLNFAGNAENEGWDGTNSGKKLPSDVYIYYIEVMCNSGTVITLKGDITLLL